MKQDYDIAEGSWGRRAFWLLVGVAVPLALWLMNRGSDEEEPATAPPQPAPPAPPPEPEVEVVDTVSAPAEPSPLPEAAPESAPESASEDVMPDHAAEVATDVAASAAAAAVDGAASGTAEDTVPGRFPMKARLVDSKDVSHEVDIVHLDLKSVHIGAQPPLEKKEKVSVHLADGKDTLTLGAYLEKEPTEEGVQVLTLFVRGGQKKRLQNFLQS